MYSHLAIGASIQFPKYESFDEIGLLLENLGQLRPAETTRASEQQERNKSVRQGYLNTKLQLFKAFPASPVADSKTKCDNRF
jgi:hypothetical protein